jgi:hypothetical protein
VRGDEATTMLGLDAPESQSRTLRQELPIERRQRLDCGPVASEDVQENPGPVPGGVRDQEA